jgi:hypothetical protein
MPEAHFVRDYNRLVRHLVAVEPVEPDYEVAMARAVGGGPYVGQSVCAFRFAQSGPVGPLREIVRDVVRRARPRWTRLAGAAIYPKAAILG